MTKSLDFEATVATLDDEEAALRLLTRATDENTALKKRVAMLESDLDTQRTWWPFHEDDISRGWAVNPGEEEPSGFVAVFSDKAEAERYAVWRQEQERAADEDERVPSWEYLHVLESEFRVRIWASFDPAPPQQVVAERDALRQRVAELERELRAAQTYDREDLL